MRGELYRSVHKNAMHLHSFIFIAKNCRFSCHYSDAVLSSTFTTYRGKTRSQIVAKKRERSVIPWRWLGTARDDLETTFLSVPRKIDGPTRAATKNYCCRMKTNSEFNSVRLFRERKILLSLRFYSIPNFCTLVWLFYVVTFIMEITFAIFYRE